jgi:hypothetical protein
MSRHAKVTRYTHENPWEPTLKERIMRAVQGEELGVTSRELRNRLDIVPGREDDNLRKAHRRFNQALAQLVKRGHLRKSGPLGASRYYFSKPLPPRQTGSTVNLSSVQEMAARVERFREVWETSESPAEVAARLGRTKRYVIDRASTLRARGIRLQYFSL